MFSFAYPWLLLLIIPCLLIVVYIGWFKKQPTVRIASTGAMTGGGAGRRLNWLVIILYLLAMVLLVGALARPRLGNELVKIRAQGIDIMLALDISGSMTAYDIPSDLKLQSSAELERVLKSGKLKDRLQVAEEELARFVEKRPNDRIGLVAFGTHAYALAPTTLDHELIYEHLKNLESGQLGENTNIAGAIASGTRKLADREAPRRVLVLFTDGRNTVDMRVTPLEAAELAKAKDVVIYTVGIGSNRSIMPYNTPFGRRYAPLESDFDEPSLRKIAEVTEGKYFRANDSAGLEEALDEINQLEKTSVEQPKIVEYREYAPWLALLALALLVVVFTLEKTVYLRCP